MFRNKIEIDFWLRISIFFLLGAKILYFVFVSIKALENFPLPPEINIVFKFIFL